PAPQRNKYPHFSSAEYNNTNNNISQTPAPSSQANQYYQHNQLNNSKANNNNVNNPGNSTISTVQLFNSSIPIPFQSDGTTMQEPSNSRAASDGNNDKSPGNNTS